MPSEKNNAPASANSKATDTGARTDESAGGALSFKHDCSTAARYRVMLDGEPHPSKPSGPELGAATKRMQQAGPREVTLQELGEAIARGQVFCCGAYTPSAEGWGEFEGQRLFGVDVDNKFRHAALKRGYPGFLAFEDGVQRAAKLIDKGMFAPALIVYETFSSTEACRKYRIIFDRGEEIADEAEARGIIEKLLRAFPEADQACSNPSRLWCGTCNEVEVF